MYIQVIEYELCDIEDDNDKNGPKWMRDASVWAIGEFFYSFFYTKQIFYSIYRLISTKYAALKLAMMRTGPNDASRIVWAISMFFFFFSSFT